MKTNPYRIQPLEPGWINWMRNTIALLTNGGVMVFPNCGVAYQVDKEAHTLTAVVEHPLYDHEGEIAILTERCAEKVGYRVIYLEEPARTPEALDDLVKGGNFLIDGDLLVKMHEYFQRNRDQSKWPEKLRRWGESRN
jgi:hypothetical protein